jgi:hypothetical protein
VPPPNEAGCLVILLPTKRVYIPSSCSQWFEIPHQSDGCTKICKKKKATYQISEKSWKCRLWSDLLRR